MDEWIVCKDGLKPGSQCHRTTCDKAAGTAWNTVPTYENIRRRQQQQPSQVFAADMPAKLNSSQLRRLTGVKACDGCCCHWRMFSYRNSIPGSTGSYVAGSLAAYENQA